MPSKPILIAQTINYIYQGVVGLPSTPTYTPPVGGFVLNTEAELDAVVWTDTVYGSTKPLWTDILMFNDASYPWATMQDVLANWVTVKGEATQAESMTALTAILSGYLTSMGAMSTYCAQATTVNGKALNANIVLAASDIAGIPAAQVQSDWNATTGLGVILNKPGIPKVYFGTTLKTVPIFYTASATVASGVAVFQLTADGTSTGTALFPNGPNTDSLNIFVSDATASYQMSYALTNSNKTLTVTANKLTTANILTGILGQANANGAVVRLQVWGS